MLLHAHKSEKVKRSITSILGGYVLDDENPLVRNPDQALAAVESGKSIQTWANGIVQVVPGESVEPQKTFDYGAALKKQDELTRALFERGLP